MYMETCRNSDSVRAFNRRGGSSFCDTMWEWQDATWHRINSKDAQVLEDAYSQATRSLHVSRTTCKFVPFAVPFTRATLVQHLCDRMLWASTPWPWGPTSPSK